MTFYIQKVKGHLHCDCFVKKNIWPPFIVQKWQLESCSTAYQHRNSSLKAFLTQTIPLKLSDIYV